MIETILGVMVVGALAVTMYLVPVMVAVARRAPDVAAVAVVNILLGWTFAGWVIALAMALRSPRPAMPDVRILQNLPPGGWPGWHGWPGEPGWHEQPQALPPGDDDDPDWRGWGER